jgi:hypothetical protein
MIKTTLFCGLFVMLVLQTESPAQKIIRGYIKDKETSAALPAANILIEGTFKGTISNEDGAYVLKIDDIPANLIVSYIGYATQKISVNAASPQQIDLFMTPVAYELEPIVVTGEDPAVRIMREVIERKKQWRSTLQSYHTEAYTRLVLENDTSITSIMESISSVFWDKKRGIREVIISRRQTSNMSANDNFAGAGEMTNLYDDDIDIVGFKLIGVTHPDALHHYDFHLEGQRQRDNQVVYDISVKPKGKLQPTFVGHVAVLDSVFALLEVDLKPGEAVLFPPPIQKLDLHYHQQFNNFGTPYWLPVDVRVNGSIKIGFVGLQFPSIIINRISRLHDYEINITLPDSLYQEKNIVRVDSSLIRRNADSVFTENPEVVPFSQEEKAAYSTLDSTMTLEKAYRPTGALARFVKIESDNQDNTSLNTDKSTLLSGLSPVLGFDRVDEAVLGIRKTMSLRKQKLSLYGGYLSGLEQWFYGIDLQFNLLKSDKWKTDVSFSQNTDTRFTSPIYSRLINSVPVLLGYRDYFDYYRNRKLHIDLGYAWPAMKSWFILGFQDEIHSSLLPTTNYNILGRDIFQRANPPIAAGHLRSLTFLLHRNEDYIPWGVVGQNYWQLQIEHSSPDLIPTDFNFTRYQLSVDFRIFTFLRRRLLPNTLDIHITAATYRGTLPPQRFGIVDGSLQVFSPYPSLKTLIGKAYEGEKYLGVFWEHNFRTVPFEILGWHSLARKNIGFILYGALARSWIKEKTLRDLNYRPVYINHFHQEIGLSLTGLFNLLRMDFTRRLDESGFFVSLGLSRLY